MKTKHHILTILLISFYTVSAQKVYKTNDGHIMMMALVDNQSTKAESNELDLYLDYDSKVVSGSLDLRTLSTDITVINTILQEEEEPLMLHFTGTIPSVDFLLKVHDPINFNWLVTITYKDKTYKSIFKTTITHIYEGITMSCLISARGQVLVSNTGLKDLIPALDETIEVQFAQMVLRLE